MKKLIIALTVMAMASMASAAIVASWTTTTADNVGDLNTIAETGGYGYSFVMNDGGFATGGTSSAGAYSMAPGAQASASAAYGAGNYIYFTWDTDYTLSLDAVNGRYSRSGTGPQTVQWGTIISSVWTDIGSAVSVTQTATPTTALGATATTFTGVSGLESGQLGMAVYGGTGTANNNWVRLDSRPTTTPQVALSLDGTMTPTAVPEPATMGLLGLGALAMALRRKLSK